MLQVTNTPAPPGCWVAELAWMEQVSRDSGRPLSFAITQSDRRPDLWSWVMEQTAAARARGADLRPQTSARGTAILYGLSGRTPYDALPSWARLLDLEPAERLSEIDRRIEQLEDEHRSLVAEREWLNRSLLEFDDQAAANGRFLT